MKPSTFLYVTYIRTTPQALWNALTDREFTQQYWFGATVESAFTAGAPWKITLADGRVADTGEILEADPPKRMVIKWRNEFRPELKAEGHSRCTLALDPLDDGTVKLTITHEIDRPDSQLIVAVSGGWPRIMSNLKTLLETGQPLSTTK